MSEEGHFLIIGPYETEEDADYDSDALGEMMSPIPIRVVQGRLFASALEMG